MTNFASDWTRRPYNKKCTNKISYRISGETVDCRAAHLQLLGKETG